VVYGIVRNNLAHIPSQPHPGKGPRFDISLPACPPPTPAEQAPPATLQALPLTQNLNILLVEDELAVQRVAEQILRSFGCTVLLAESGDEALQRHQQHLSTIDLVITDLVMPGISGLDLIQRLRHIRSDLPAIVISGYPDQYLDPANPSPTTCHFLQKPFRRDDLLAAIQRALPNAAPRT
ncbi:MAG TPA: response regulator, partial [Kiritimatiellia bacterium]|nr:response regulator [Kiritimatiellia bacterium]